MRRRLLLGGAVIGVAGLLAAAGAVAFADATLPDDFSDGDADGWSKSGGAWSVVSDGGNKAYQQSKVASELARAFAGDADATDYAVRARVKPTAYSSANGFVGIAARATGSTSFYRLVVTSRGRVELHAVKSGAVTVLSGVDVTVTTGAWHTLALEVSGGVLRGSVDGTAVVSGASTLLASGRVGLTTAYATAAFDDVTVSSVGALPSPAPTSSPSPMPSASPTKAPATSASPTKAATSSPTPSPSASATTSTAAMPAWPKPAGEKKVVATVPVPASGLDGGMKRYYGIGDGGQSESQDPMFKLADGAVLQNVIIGAPAGDGVHCAGSCTLKNVWWEDVGEDAATFKGGASARYTVDGGGARSASDKVFQHNGGGTLTIRNFQVENFGKLYRSCGNCSTQHKRTVVIQNVRVTAPGKALAGINTNYGDTATFSGVTIVGDSGRKVSICDRFTGNSSGAEPPKTGSGADGTHCRYSASDITYK
ncbi:pectate lyase [Micromonospora sp. CPCC 205371]|nr:pectate lyase [Micromonospora sp. CPCC 205371]